MQLRRKRVAVGSQKMPKGNKYLDCQVCYEGPILVQHDTTYVMCGRCVAGKVEAPKIGRK